MGSVASNYFTVAGAAEGQRLPVFLAFVFTMWQVGSRINVEEVRKGKTVCRCAAQINSRGEAMFVIVIIIISDRSLARARESIWCPEMARHQKRRTMPLSQSHYLYQKRDGAAPVHLSISTQHFCLNK